MIDKPKTIGTHWGRFHPDEVCATAALRILFPFANVVRSRDPDVLKTCDILIDVGHEYAPERGRFDHHQPGGAGQRKCGIQYSSFGLIWQAYGLSICDGDEKAAKFVDNLIGKCTDARDNNQELYKTEGPFGNVRHYEFADFIDSLNPDWDEEDKMEDERFMQAVKVAQLMLTSLIRRAKAATRAMPSVREALTKMEDRRILVLGNGRPWQEVVVREPAGKTVQFVVYRNPERVWQVQCVPVKLGQKTYRRDLPKAWSGLKEEAFEAATGVKGAKYCHNNLFICGAYTREGAIALAKLAVG